MEQRMKAFISGFRVVSGAYSAHSSVDLHEFSFSFPFPQSLPVNLIPISLDRPRGSPHDLIRV